MTASTPFRVLYIHPVGIYGGSTKSLVEMLTSIPPNTLDGTIILPRGSATQFFSSIGLKTIPLRGIPQFDDTRYGYYRGLRWLILFRELFYWPSVLIALWRVKRTLKIDLIHCNEITALMPSVCAKILLGVPLVVHVRSLQRGPDGGFVTQWLMKILASYADSIIAIDMAVRRTLPNFFPVRIIHNGLRMISCVSSKKTPNKIFTIGVIGVLHRSKGLFELLNAVSILRDRSIVIRLLIVGENSRNPRGILGWILGVLNFAHDTRSELDAMVKKLKIAEFVSFTGFIQDIREIYRQIDVVCFPSHLDAPGRPVLEAALFGIPSIVAMSNPTDDVVKHEKTGLCIERPSPELIANAIEILALNPEYCRNLGKGAQDLASCRFDSVVTAINIMNVYSSLIRR